jgi:Domain of unknown function (DUF5134)
MTAPPWLTGAFVAVMILIVAYSAGRLLFSRLRRRATEVDVDTVHALMGAAMAGMFLPRLSLLPDSAWAAVFGTAAAWFGWHAVRARGPGNLAAWQCRFPVPHLVECATMLYMLLPAHGWRPPRGGAGTTMAGMSGSAGPAGTLPALAVVLALFMLGYILWNTDRLTTLARAKTTAADPGSNRDPQPAAAVLTAAPLHNAGGPPAAAAATKTRHGEHPAQLPLAPKLAAIGKIAMSITMGYMLILTL